MKRIKKRKTQSEQDEIVASFERGLKDIIEGRVTKR